ncbi:MAG: peptide chain release factor N(5)-glutamine methyltransferase [Deltaproteobacteria bacterium]|nr:peptide chain release factor N(5)-glutamine methyltransferase [Deltaproteobacteria bacterium]
MSSDLPAAWTIIAALQRATKHLQAKGISEPRASAEVLLAHCLHLSRLELYLRHDQPLAEDELSCYKKSLKRRLAREPTQYITGHQEFWSLDFLVSPAALIPRPETELLAEAVLMHIKQAATSAPHILDVGTGSGVLAVVVAKEIAGAQVTALDRSWEALCLARENARRHGVLGQIAFIQGDLLTPFALQPHFTAAMANLPYVPTAAWEQLPPDIRDYEPRLALDGGYDGLGVIRTLVLGAHHLLRPGGLLALEVGQGQAEAVQTLLAQQGAYSPAEIILDYQRLGRIVLARRRG